MHARDFTSSYYSFFHSHNHAKRLVFIYKESTYSFNLTAKVRPLYRYFFHIAFLGMSREGRNAINACRLRESALLTFPTIFFCFTDYCLLIPWKG